jgi:hypothetical protein
LVLAQLFSGCILGVIIVAGRPGPARFSGVRSFAAERLRLVVCAVAAMAVILSGLSLPAVRSAVVSAVTGRSGESR